MKTEVANLNAINVATEMMPFKKFAQMLNKVYSDETIKITGTYKDKITGQVFNKDIFEAHKCGSLEETYKTYLAWFNHTIMSKFENPREFVSVKLYEQGDDNL